MQSKAIGVLLPSLTNHLVADVLKGIEQVADIAGYRTMLAHYGYSVKKKKNVSKVYFPIMWMD